MITRTREGPQHKDYVVSIILIFFLACVFIMVVPTIVSQNRQQQKWFDEVSKLKNKVNDRPKWDEPKWRNGQDLNDPTFKIDETGKRTLHHLRVADGTSSSVKRNAFPRKIQLFLDD